MKHYNFREIKEKGSCIAFAEQILGIRVNDGRCAATWRDGKRDSVAIDAEKWYDHASQEGGGLVELCARTRFGGMDMAAIQEAQEFLGEWLGLSEFVMKKSPSVTPSRYDELIADGYTETARYEYRDLDDKLIYFVVRMQHPEKKKEFLQGTPDRWGIGDITPIPYNWKAIDESNWCVIVEGEKDVETLKRIGVPATTNSGGAKKWREEFAEYFRGKNVIILPDNDDVGKEHAALVASQLYGKAAGIKVVISSTLPKGDVTDYFEKENGNWETLAAKIKDAPEFSPVMLSPVDEAKEANKKPFRNFEYDDSRRKPEKIPRRIGDMVRDIHTRLLGAPFRVGGELFDRDRDTGKISYIYDSSDLFSWISLKTKCLVDWARIDGCITKQEFFSALKREAAAYSAISFTPDFPRRKDVFYTHPDMPLPSEGHKVFKKFVDFFNPVDDVNKSLLAAFIMAPIFYRPMVARPLWIIDSPDGQGSGKSMIPEMVAHLYGENMFEGKPIDVSLRDLDWSYQEVVKRIISTEGRNSRILRLDNVTGTLKSSNLAMLITTGSISGRASYGRGEESRPNNLTYVVTINGATVDTDIASRAFYLMIAKPKMNPNWVSDITRYIETHRMEIFADIIDMISRHRAFDVAPATRMPQFETEILQPACETPEQYQKVLDFLLGKKEETNVDEELARRIEEEICSRLVNVRPALGKSAFNPMEEKIFIRSHVLESWFKNEAWLEKKHICEIIRNMARTKKLPQVDPIVTRYPSHAGTLKRRSGVMWNYSGAGRVRVVGWDPKGAHEVIEG